MKFKLGSRDFFLNSLSMCTCLSFCAVSFSSATVENTERKLNFRKYPAIGRLFKADVVRSLDGFSVDNNKNPGRQTFGDSSTNPVIRHMEENPHREGKSKSVIISGTKYDVDSSQDKIKKQGYEFTKKPIKRTSARRRTKRSNDNRGVKQIQPSTSVKEKLEDHQDNLRVYGSSFSNMNTSYDESSLRKSYVQKAFKKRIEELFEDKSGLTQEEVEKSKSLRKKLLNLYVRGKQKKYIQHGDSNNATTVHQTDRVDDGETKEPHLIIKIAIPNKDLDIIEKINIGEDDNDNKVGSQGRSGRRRIRKVIIPLLLALKLKTALVIPLLFGAVSLIAFKGLWAGMTALAMVSALALKSLMHGKNSVTYEIRPPPHFHFPHHVHDVGHHGFVHPDYHWSRSEDSYKPNGGWRDGEVSDHPVANFAEPLVDSSYSTIRTEDVVNDVGKCNTTEIEKI